MKNNYTKININGTFFSIPIFVLHAILNRAEDIQKTTGINMIKITEIELIKWRDNNRKEKIQEALNGNSNKEN